ncbi:MAG: glycoside hydrolase family 3 protein [Candidatus Fibromonas sp.]|jgi:beta-glucosidase|nr:glycoside hydrolase family 3 protein [Candidatus Fibromonas sp.]
MRTIFLFSAIFFMAGGIFAAPLNLTGTVKALSESGTSVENAVVLLKVNDNLLAYARTLSNSAGQFTLLPNKEAPGEVVTPVARPAAFLPVRYASYQAMDLKGRAHSPHNLPQGIYVLLGKTESGKSVNLGTVYHRGGALKVGEVAQKEQKVRTLAKLQTTAGDEVQLIVRKAGFLPKEVSISSFDEDVGVVVLERDPLEARIDSVMAMMSQQDKIYQMTQPLVTAGSSSNGSLFGSVLEGGGGYTSTFLNSMNNALNALASTKAKIPVTYGKDFVHGTADIENSTIFPHNIGLGATRDSVLVREIGEATAKESWAGKVDLIFGPAISVPQNERWGRVYEGFGETAELAAMMGAAMVRGLQGEKYNADWRVISTAKHYLADGSTTNGKDRGNNATITDEELREIHLPGYEAVVEQGVLSVMASFNQIRGKHQHVDSLRLTGWLKTELGFDGYIISDWLGIGNSLSPGSTDANDYGGGTTTDPNAIKNAINAGIDLAMEPGSQKSFIDGLTTLVNNGSVPQARIDDAVRRILRAKFRAGRMDKPQGPTAYSSAKGTHRNLAREAVRKSLVLLKNDNSALPISKSAKVYLFGNPTDIITNTSYQCGGWTLGWRGSYNTGGPWGGEITTPKNVPGATSIQAGINLVANGAITTNASEASVVIYVTGESPYAEWHGDITDITFNDNNASQLNTYKGQGKKVVTVFISGRPREVTSLLNASDAFVAAWLPGSEGAGIADVLFEGDYNFTGKLPHTWPRNKSVFPVNSTQESPNWFPYGHGLNY